MRTLLNMNIDIKKPSLVNIDILHELRDSYAQKVFRVGEVDMSLVEDLIIFRRLLIKEEVHQFFAGQAWERQVSSQG